MLDPFRAIAGSLRYACGTAAFRITAACVLAGGIAAFGRASDADLPLHLHETGLFVSAASSDIRAENLPFSPQYPLWSDGASKRRWLYLPKGTAIDGSNPDVWEFPLGTRIWKEFSHERKVETRYMERLGDGSWRYATYVWNEDGTDAVLAPRDGIAAHLVNGAPDGRYAVPSEGDCLACHEGAATPVLGFGALQLSPDRDPLSIHADPQKNQILICASWWRTACCAIFRRSFSKSRHASPRRPQPPAPPWVTSTPIAPIVTTMPARWRRWI